MHRESTVDPRGYDNIGKMLKHPQKQTHLLRIVYFLVQLYSRYNYLFMCVRTLIIDIGKMSKYLQKQLLPR
jgi:hypothetical protein